MYTACDKCRPGQPPGQANLLAFPGCVQGLFFNGMDQKVDWALTQSTLTSSMAAADLKAVNHFLYVALLRWG